MERLLSLGVASASPLPGPRTRPPGTVGVRTWQGQVSGGNRWGATDRGLAGGQGFWPGSNNEVKKYNY